MTVELFPLPEGGRPGKVVAFGRPACNGAMLALTGVSSLKTGCVGSMRP